MDQQITDEEITRRLWENQYQSKLGEYNSISGSEFRCRMIGYDTQESPRPGDEYNQSFWQEGRDFLETTLTELKGDIPDGEALILADCYGVDIYERLLIDIRGICNRQTPSPVPALRRFELANKALRTGYAYPCASFFCDEDLAASFQLAISEQRGAFGQEDEFVHPLRCRRARYQQQIDRSLRRRRRYVE